MNSEAGRRAAVITAIQAENRFDLLAWELEEPLSAHGIITPPAKKAANNILAPGTRPYILNYAVARKEDDDSELGTNVNENYHKLRNKDSGTGATVVDSDTDDMRVDLTTMEYNHGKLARELSKGRAQRFSGGKNSHRLQVPFPNLVNALSENCFFADFTGRDHGCGFVFVERSHRIVLHYQDGEALAHHATA